MPEINDYFFKHIKYICKANNFIDLLNYLLIHYKELVIINYKYFIDILNLEYIQLFQNYNIHFINKQDVTSFDEYDFEEIKII